MGLLANWFYQATMPLRSFKMGLVRFKQQLFAPFTRQKNLAKGVVTDVRQLAGKAGLNRKPNVPPRRPPP